MPLLLYSPKRKRIGATDANWTNVSLLCNFETGFVNIKDNYTLVPTGTIALANSGKFGSQCLKLSSTTQAEYISETNDKIADFGVLDFTMECWIYPTSLGDLSDFLNTGATGLGGLTVRLTANNFVNVYNTASTVNTPNVNVTGVTAVKANVWTHVAVCRSGNNLRLFVNGILEGVASTALTFNGTVIRIGSVSKYFKFLGLIDEVRVTKGVARYISNFSVPTAAYPTI